ncbi:hypothetical protein D3C86_1743840 [compost metagenome]
MDIPPAMNRRLDPLLRAVSVADVTAIIGENLKAVLVMQLQNLAKSEAHGMVAKIRREVADAQPLTGPRLLLR